MKFYRRPQKWGPGPAPSSHQEGLGSDAATTGFEDCVGYRTGGEGAESSGGEVCQDGACVTALTGDSSIDDVLFGRLDRFNNEILITLVTARRPRILSELAERLTSSVPEIVGVHVHVNSEPGNAIYDVGEEGIGSLRLEGKLAIEEKLAGVQAPPASGQCIEQHHVRRCKCERER